MKEIIQEGRIQLKEIIQEGRIKLKEIIQEGWDSVEGDHTAG